MSENIVILLLEPDPTEAELMTFQLRKGSLPFTIRRVSSKDQLLRALESDHPDVVVANHATPRFDLTGTLASSASLGIPWIVYGVNPDEDTIVQAFHAGAVDVVSKKRIARFGTAVRRAIERSRNSAPPLQPQTSEAPIADEQAPQDGAHSLIIRQALDGIEDYFAIVDLDGKRVFNSGSYSEIIDDPDELYGTDCFADIFPEDRDKIRLAFQTTVETGKGQLTEYRMMTEAGTVRYIESRGHLLRDENGDGTHVVIVSRDITERRKQELALVSLVESGKHSGLEYFETMIKNLSAAVGVRYALISVRLSQEPPRVRSLAFCVDGMLQPGFEYDLEGTVCATVFAEGKTQYFPRRLQEQFPQETALAAMGADSYVGQPIMDSENVVRGHVFVMHTEPIRDPDRTVRILKLVAARAMEELATFELPPVEPAEMPEDQRTAKQEA